MAALPRTPRTLGVTLAGVLATACGAPAATSVAPRAPTMAPPPVAVSEVAPTAPSPVVITTVVEPVATGPMILIDPPHDPNHVGATAAATVGVTVQQALGRAGFTTAPRVSTTPEVNAEFIVTPTLHSLTISPEGSRTTISCSITLRISPWSQDEQVERWEAGSSASATGEARATTSSARAQVTLGVRDCLEGAVRAAAAREVIPFLRRLTLESKNISDVTSRTEL